MFTTTTLKQTFRLTKLYRELNEQYFHNLLGSCTFEALPGPAPDAPTIACIRIHQKRTGGYTAHIKFNSRIPWNETTLRETLIHELIHYYNVVKHKRQFLIHHGLRFHLVMWRINLQHHEHIRVFWPEAKTLLSTNTEKSNGTC